MSSRFIMFPCLYARRYSEAGVSFDVKITLSPFIPESSESISSGALEQSAPQPSSERIFKIYGLGHAFTAKCSRNFGKMLNAFVNSLMFSLIAFSS